MRSRYYRVVRLLKVYVDTHVDTWNKSVKRYGHIHFIVLSTYSTKISEHNLINLVIRIPYRGAIVPYIGFVRNRGN